MEVNTQVEPQEKKKTPKGRAKKRITYTRRFVNVTLTGGKRKVSTAIMWYKLCGIF
jgi:small subunit ribosomal protein S30e